MGTDKDPTRNQPVSLEFIGTFLPEDPVIVEAGAKFGTDTKKMSLFWPKGRIFTFEPVPELYSATVHNTRNYRNVKCCPLALSERSGEDTLFVSSGKSVGASSLLRPNVHLNIHPDTFFNSEIEVRTISIDDFAEQENISAVDFLWLDTQGTELAIMKGAPRIMKTVKLIHTEVSLMEVYDNAPLYAEVRQWLESQGFCVIAEELPWADMGNVLFKRVR